MVQWVRVVLPISGTLRPSWRKEQTTCTHCTLILTHLPWCTHMRRHAHTKCKKITAAYAFLVFPFKVPGMSQVTRVSSTVSTVWPSALPSCTQQRPLYLQFSHRSLCAPNSPNPGDVSDCLIQTSGRVSTTVWQKWRVRNQPHIFLSQIQFSKIQINTEFSYFGFHKISQITDRILNSRWNTAVKFKDWNTLIVKTIVFPGTKTRIKGERH